MKRDFTIGVYGDLLDTLKEAGYVFCTFAGYCKTDVHGRLVIMRHDVDKKPENALRIAQLEYNKDVKASYYFRCVPGSNDADTIKKIAELGHEIGYHYEDLSLFNGNEQKAIEHFERQLAYFRTFYPVVTVCMHGSPLSKFDNKDIWKKYDYRKFAIVGEPYFDFVKSGETNKIYLTDTGRMWNNRKGNVRDVMETSNKDISHIHNTADLINWIKNTNESVHLMINTHPQRWTDNGIGWFSELVGQKIKNIIKTII